jgi:preprotein translocase subunit SecD
MVSEVRGTQVRRRHFPSTVAEGETVNPLPSKPKLSWGLIAVLLAAIAICASMCQYAADKIETEEVGR